MSDLPDARAMLAAFGILTTRVENITEMTAQNTEDVRTALTNTAGLHARLAHTESALELVLARLTLLERTTHPTRSGG